MIPTLRLLIPLGLALLPLHASTDGSTEKLLMPHAAYRPLPLGAVLPEGWLKTELRKQADGITGHQPDFCYPFDRHYWAGQEKGQDKESRNGGTWWYPWEQIGYWTDGAYRCARLLGDETFKKRAMEPIRFTLANPLEGWFLGSQRLLKSGRDPGRWPHAVFFRALAAAGEGENDPAIAEAMRKHYLNDKIDYTGGAFGPRERIHIESLLWCYAHTGDRALLDKALEIWKGIPAKDIEDWTTDKPGHMHGVSFAELSKLAALIYLYTGDEKALQISTAMMDRAAKYHMLVDGIPSTTEALTSTTALDGHETCDIVEFNWSWGYLLMASGDGSYADRIERGLFNAGMGSIRKDWKGVQYISCPNQVTIDPNSCQVGWIGSAAAMYGPNTDHRPQFPFVTSCCAGNVSRMMPNYIERMWMDAKNGLAATLYGPCRVSTTVGEKRTPVEIVEKTSYPFSDRIQFLVNPKEPVAFPLHLRIPAWCKNAKLAVNGKAVDLPAVKNGFVTLDRTFAPGDIVQLDLPMETAVAAVSGGAAVERGPLVYSLKIKEDWKPLVDPDFEITNKDFPMWCVTPGTPWNYSLAVDSDKPVAEQIQVIASEAGDDPWSHSPISLQVPARRLEGWQLWERKKTFKINNSDTEVTYRSTPHLPEGPMLFAAVNAPIEKVDLVPLGSTHLRVTVFPVIPPQPLAVKVAKASSVYGPDLEAGKAVDGDSQTRWAAQDADKDRWIEVDLGQPTRIGRATLSEKFWKGTRGFVIETKDGDAWKEIARGGEIGDNLTLDFPPVEARFVRLRIVDCKGSPNINEFQLFAPSGKNPISTRNQRT